MALYSDRSLINVSLRGMIFLIWGLVFWTGFNLNQVSQAEIATVVVNLPIDNQLVNMALTTQAEAVANREISRRFGQNSEISSIEIVVLGDSNGEVAPILSVIVSRSQWMENPAIDSWSTRYDAAYQLFQRHEEESREGIFAGIPIRSALARNGGRESNQGAFQSRKSPGRLLPWQVHEAYDSGRLSGDEIQRYIDDMD